MKNKKIIISWIAVITIMMIIFYFSNQSSNVSSTTSTGLTRVIFDFFNLDNFLIFDSFHGLIRKVAHFVIYGLLGLSMYNALFQTKKREYINILLMTIVLVMAYALTDEIHQLFISGRSAEVRDVLIDTIGGSIGGIIYYFYLKIKY